MKFITKLIIHQDLSFVDVWWWINKGQQEWINIWCITSRHSTIICKLIRVSHKKRISWHTLIILYVRDVEFIPICFECFSECPLCLARICKQNPQWEICSQPLWVRTKTMEGGGAPVRHSEFIQHSKKKGTNRSVPKRFWTGL